MYTDSMRLAGRILAAALALAACARGPRPLFVEDESVRPEAVSSAEQERRAYQAILDIERRIARGDLPKINFEFDKDEITPESFPTLDLIAQVMLDNPKLKVLCLAHTDYIGTDEYNQDLSERRAKSVKGYLVKKGIYPPFIRFKGYGKSRPMADNETEEGRAKNRRVEFRVTTRDWQTVY